ncbi:MAG: cell division protein FtsQ/DivIB [Rhodobacteraceae bacterium]|nr:cell division protein FtsQ/DivIB [Paracoccaceae bacterium]
MRPLNALWRGRAGDPAPSRLAYRLQRLWLTPLYRATVRVGLPAFAVVLGVGLWFSDADNRQRLADLALHLQGEVAGRPEFAVRLMAIDGASPVVAEAIREIAPVRLPASSFEIDLDAVRAAVADLDAVAAVDVRIRAGGILQVDVTERVPAVVWRGPGGLDLLDNGGRRVASLATRGARPDLPLIAGEGADAAVPEALALVAAAGPVADRLRGLVRVGERRWDVVLADDARGDQTILLPERGAVTALELVLALDAAQDLFARDLVSIDVRNIHRPTLRLRAPAVEELARIRTLAGAPPRQ